MRGLQRQETPYIPPYSTTGTGAFSASAGSLRTVRFSHFRKQRQEVRVWDRGEGVFIPLSQIYADKMSRVFPTLGNHVNKHIYEYDSGIITPIYAKIFVWACAHVRGQSRSTNRVGGPRNKKWGIIRIWTSFYRGCRGHFSFFSREIETDLRCQICCFFLIGPFFHE